jgi:hypothetical protein
MLKRLSIRLLAVLVVAMAVAAPVVPARAARSEKAFEAPRNLQSNGALARSIAGNDEAPAGNPAEPAPVAPQAGAEVSVSGAGATRIDGTPAVTGATLFSGSRITTDAGATATVTISGSRVTLGENTDAVISFSDSWVRVDIVCGSASTAAAPGAKIEVVTKDYANVHVQSGSAQVVSEGKASDLASDQHQTFLGSSRTTASDGSSVEVAALDCAGMCTPAPFPTALVATAATAGISAGVIAAIVGGVVAGVTVPVVNDDEEPPVSPSRP